MSQVRTFWLVLLDLISKMNLKTLVSNLKSDQSQKNLQNDPKIEKKLEGLKINLQSS